MGKVMAEGEMFGIDSHLRKYHVIFICKRQDCRRCIAVIGFPASSSKGTLFFERHKSLKNKIKIKNKIN
ncbi:unnamed protein product [Paramecium octaurelia]|uniref:Uncharacterized protein n=1 Tax=Paramecium octaurelia TaxID=43137 RepID=A0A8S1XM41_PAROT|nr:unnamed protein product [Paramecium octaurelia]